MIKRLTIGLAYLLTTIGLALYPIATANAAFDKNRIMDDSVFESSTSMNAGAINTFLNSFGGSCISPNNGFATPDPQGWSTSQNKYLFGGNVTAGQAIYDVAQLYHVNPQVILSTLQKEQSLVSGGAGCYPNEPNPNWPPAGSPQNGATFTCSIGGKSQTCTYACTHGGGCMNIAVGYGCPNYCAAKDEGFSMQITLGTWLLRFGEQRAYGNLTGYTGYESGDEYFCYSGIMTPGNRARSASATACGGTHDNVATYYDGSGTLADGTSVVIANGTTSTLYNFTPFISGNQSFYNIFSGWFGSTSYPEPLGSLLAVDNQTGQIYFISTANNTRYAIPSWSTLEAYGLNGYHIIPMDDSAITGYSNGGILRTLVFDNNTQSIFLVDHGQKFSFSQYCTQWGLDCLGHTPGSVSNLNNTYFDQMLPYGGSDQPLMQVNGQFFLMNNGTKSPFATPTDMQAAGYSTTQDIPIIQTDLNATQPLGPLQINRPTFITFNGNLMMYFDGQSYHQVPNLPIYYAWGSQQVLIPPASSTDNNVPSNTSTLSNWVKDSNNKYYLIDAGKKMDITADPTNWHSGSFESIPAAGLNWLSTIAEQHNIYSQGNAYVLQNNTLRYVPTPEDYYGLGMSSGNTVTLSADAISTIPAGPNILRDGAPYTVNGSDALYITNNNTSLYVPTVSMALDFGVDWNTIRFKLNPNVLSTGYPLAGTLTRWVKPGGGALAYITNKNIVSISSDTASKWGINTTTQPATTIDSAALYKTTGTMPLGQFVRDTQNGGMYYGTGGASHYIEAYSAFVNLGGTTANIINVSDDFLTAMPAGYSYGW